MTKQVKVKALQVRKRECRFPLGRKSVVVWHYISGRYKMMYQVCCSLYPEFGGMFFEREKAIQRAHAIVSFYYRQLELTWGDEDVKYNNSKKL